MRRIPIIATVLMAALLLCQPALAKRTQVSLLLPSAVPHVGAPWFVRVAVRIDGKATAPRAYHPLLVLHDRGGRFFAGFHGVRTARPAVFRVRLVFPHAGRFTISVSDPIMGDWTFPAVRVSG